MTGMFARLGHIEVIGICNERMMQLSLPTATAHFTEPLIQLDKVSSTEGTSNAAIQATWWHLLDRHIGHVARQAHLDPSIRVHVHRQERFTGRLRSGRVGPLGYCQLWLNDSLYEQRCVVHDPAAHVVAVHLCGVSTYRVGQRQVQASTGDIVLLRGIDDFTVEHRGNVEVILLFDAFDVETVATLEPGPFVQRRAPRGTADIAVRWLRDIVEAPEPWPEGSTADLVAHALTALVKQVLLGPANTPTQARRLDRQSLIDFIEQHLDDPAFNIASLAASMCCSVRTLYRIFGEHGSESLSTYLQRRRLEACAARMRNDPEAAQTKVIDLALRSGFSSHSHFTTAFRRRFGLTPSEYRLVCASGALSDLA